MRCAVSKCLESTLGGSIKKILGWFAGTFASWLKICDTKRFLARNSFYYMIWRIYRVIGDLPDAVWSQIDVGEIVIFNTLTLWAYSNMTKTYVRLKNDIYYAVALVKVSLYCIYELFPRFFQEINKFNFVTGNSSWPPSSRDFFGLLTLTVWTLRYSFIICLPWYLHTYIHSSRKIGSLYVALAYGILVKPTPSSLWTISRQFRRI